MSNNDTLSDQDREDLIAYLADEVDPKTASRIQTLLETNPMARKERELLEASWQILDVLDRPKASQDFQTRTASMVVNAVSKGSSPSTKRSLVGWWIGGMTMGFAVGWLVTFMLPDRHRQLLRDVALLERFEELRTTRTMGFLNLVDEAHLYDAPKHNTSKENAGS
jgi:anti-sigma factor RsiW